MIQNCSVSTIFSYLPLCSEDTWHFWVNYPFKSESALCIKFSLRAHLKVCYVVWVVNSNSFTVNEEVNVWCVCSKLTWSQTNSHFFSLSYWQSSFTLSGGRFMEFYNQETNHKPFSKSEFIYSKSSEPSIPLLLKTHKNDYYSTLGFSK